MNKNEKIFIVNNQEDEDGFNLNPGMTFMIEHVKNAPERPHRNNSENNRPLLFKIKPVGSYLSASMSAKK